MALLADPIAAERLSFLPTGDESEKPDILEDAQKLDEIGRDALARGDFARAADAFERGLGTMRARTGIFLLGGWEMECRHVEGLLLLHLGKSRRGQGQGGEAYAHAALKVFSHLGRETGLFPLTLTANLYNLGISALSLGFVEQGRRALREHLVQILRHLAQDPGGQGYVADVRSTRMQLLADVDLEPLRRTIGHDTCERLAAWLGEVEADLGVPSPAVLNDTHHRRLLVDVLKAELIRLLPAEGQSIRHDV